MPISTPQEIVAIKCPSSATDPRLDDFIELAKYYVAESTFMDKWNYAIALVACHWYTLESQGGGDDTTSGSGVVGGIMSQKEGDLQQRYGNIFQGNNNMSENRMYWMTTPAGQELMALWDACIMCARNRFV